MGTYLNPGNSGFTGIRNDIYVDKSGLINETIETPRRLTCVSRPRRFGKSFAAQIEKIYAEEAPRHYNNAQALRSVSNGPVSAMGMNMCCSRNCRPVRENIAA